MNESHFIRKIIIATLILLIFLPKQSHAQDITLAWDANTESDLAGYKLYYKTDIPGPPYNGTGATEGISPITIGLGNPDDPHSPAFTLSDSNNPQFTLSGLSIYKIYFFVATAYDLDGDESGYSIVVSNDADSDGMSDDWEKEMEVDDPDDDPDEDGLTNLKEFENRTDVMNPDTDDDVMPDGWEVNYDLDPLSAEDADQDLDGDGVLNVEEYSAGRHPKNCEPERPVLLSPWQGEPDIILTPKLETGPFSDFYGCLYPDNTHAETEWQISTSADFAEADLILHGKSNVSLRSLTVPDFILDTNTNYYWRAKFHDDGGASSAWSGSNSFMTVDSDDSDSNNDGVPDDQAVDASVDLDGNGVADISQGDMKCVKSLVGAGEIGVQAGPNASIDKIKPINPNDISHMQGEADNFPLGFVSFKAIVAGAGDPASMTVYFSKAFPSGAKYYKYDPVYGLREYPHATFGTTAAGNTYVILQLRDGDPYFGDVDGLQNTFIIDPGGVGTASETSSSSGGGGGGGGCFINTAIFGEDAVTGRPQ